MFMDDKDVWYFISERGPNSEILHIIWSYSNYFSSSFDFFYE